ILKQRNWMCDTTLTKRELGFTPQYDLERGLHETIAWYRQAGWL
ncbi:MAG: NAD(P)-dependent oxidoreductase, partial [Bacteroidales bacterium]|nr:NAD(P)-dependent oxidoreductase [Bacteroidales bacterium]